MEDRGFSIQTVKLAFMQYRQISVMNWYRAFAALTHRRLVPCKDGSPSGKSSDLRGLGPGTVFPFGSFTGIPLARLQVPQGGATKIPTQFGERIHFQQRAWPSFEVRSATRSRPEFFWRLWSTPKEDLSPRCCKHEVTLADPAQISRKKGSFFSWQAWFGKTAG